MMPGMTLRLLEIIMLMAGMLLELILGLLQLMLVDWCL